MKSKLPVQLEEANKLIFVKRYEDAKDLILKLLSHSNYYGNSLLHLRLVELTVKLNKVESTIQLFRNLEKKVTTAEERLALKSAVILAEQHSELISASDATLRFQELLKEFGGSAALYYGLGFSMEVTGNLDRALYNYEQCINCDTDFYPGFFGLSQVYYQKGDEAKGDYYFRLFEESAPFNVYGNFETHRMLSNEYLQRELYQDAETAIKSLSEWWIDNKGGCPPEIQIYQGYTLAKITECRGKQDHADFAYGQVRHLVHQILADEKLANEILYFIAKTLEEFSDFDLALKVYHRILSRETVDAEMVQKIGGQFLSMGEYQLSKQLFESACQHQPDNQELAFCLLIANLRLADVNVEDYLLAKERMRQQLGNNADRVELLSVLHHLVSKFDGDHEVQSHLGDMYLRLGNIDRASRHFTKMFELNPKSKVTGLKYAGFQLQYGNKEKSMEILEAIERQKNLSNEDRNEINWLKASNHMGLKRYQESRLALKKPLNSDPWNVSYVVFDLVNMIHIAREKLATMEVDRLLEDLMVGKEANLNWRTFDDVTKVWEKHHQFEIVYAREKIKFLYTKSDHDNLTSLVKAACRFDAGKATFDFLKLLNTNFDGPEIYWALGTLFKENWQLETACVWFEQILSLDSKNLKYEGLAFLELADCYVWRDLNYEKSIEYIKLAMSMGQRDEGQALTILAHAHLRMGQVKQAEIYLDDSSVANNIEATYLRGLLHYRNGAQLQANSVWKPLLTVRSENLRFHHIKQEVLKFYFEKEPYFEIN